MRFFCKSIIISILGSIITLQILSAASTRVDLSVRYALTGSMVFTGNGIIHSGNAIYSSGITLAQISSSTSGSVHRTLSGTNSLLSGIDVITGTLSMTLPLSSDGAYSIRGGIEDNSQQWYPLEAKSIIIDRTGPSTPTIATNYTANVGDNINLSRPTSIDMGIGGPVHYHYRLVGISASNLGTILDIDTSTTHNPLNTTLLPSGSYTITVSAFDLLGNSSSSTANLLLSSSNISPSNGGNSILPLRNSGGGGSVIMRDICLCGDYSPSYYDRRCSSNQITESGYIFHYCENIETGSQTGQKGLETIPSIAYIQTVVPTLAPHADRISYTQTNRQRVIINAGEKPASSNNDIKKNDTHVLSYNISRSDKTNSGGMTLVMNNLKRLPYYQYNSGKDEATLLCKPISHAPEGTNIGSILWGGRLRIRYCSRWGYITILCLLLISYRFTRIFDIIHPHHTSRKKLHNIGQKE